MSVEIERKYVIKKPDLNLLSTLEAYTDSEITQTYLTSEIGVTRRVRKRAYPTFTRYHETSKRRIDRMSAVEDERQITEAEYLTLLEQKKPGSSPIVKRRITFMYAKQLFELDIYPRWQSTCILETELGDRATRVEFPPFIEMVAEVTGDKRYSNAGMAMSFPEELI